MTSAINFRGRRTSKDGIPIEGVDFHKILTLLPLMMLIFLQFIPAKQGFHSRRIRKVSHNASDKVILPQLFQIWRHFQVAPVWGRRVPMSKFIKLYDIHGKRKQVMPICIGDRTCLQVKLTMMVCPKRISNVYNFTDVGFILIQHSGSMS